MSCTIVCSYKRCVKSLYDNGCDTFGITHTHTVCLVILNIFLDKKKKLRIYISNPKDNAKLQPLNKTNLTICYLIEWLNFIAIHELVILSSNFFLKIIFIYLF